MSDKTPNDNSASTSKGNNTNSAVCEEEVTPMSHAELNTLFNQMCRLSSKQIIGILHILKAREASFRDIDMDEDSEFVVDLLDLTPSTQIEVNAFVTSWLHESSDQTSDSSDGSNSTWSVSS